MSHFVSLGSLVNFFFEFGASVAAFALSPHRQGEHLFLEESLGFSKPKGNAASLARLDVSDDLGLPSSWCRVCCKCLLRLSHN